MAKHQTWPEEKRLEILAAGNAKGAVVAEVCKKYGVGTGLFYKWRAQQELGQTSKNKVGPKPPTSVKQTTNAAFAPASDASMLAQRLDEAHDFADDRGIARDRFVAEALNFALQHMKE